MKKRSEKAATASRSDRRDVTALLKNWAERLDAHTITQDPEIPGLFNQPSYLIVPSLGHLVAVFVSWLPQSGPYWSFVLAAIEDLFEVKTIAGSNTSVVLILLSDDLESQPLNQDMLLLLDRSFDFFHSVRVSELLKRPNKLLKQ